ncbi:ATP-binding protein [Kutzneria buriramensis]|uniref:Anti-anti-sigma factor n=1 Tax=Kutzneria buriramensis TaxID=1045776 RepID=A0A3E0I6Q8_9PSEU|nr:ATP-binding protein [Kutzneria buriramensis]REH54428.1 anti-anti-sigma factor [Kutzneria buriramensis]
MTSPELTVDVVRHGKATIVRLAGELGMRSVPHLRSALLKCLADEPSGVIVELDGATVAAPVALGVFQTLARRAAEWPGVLLVLAVGEGPMRDLLRRSALDRTVPTLPSVAEALRSLGGMPPRRHAEIDLPADATSAALARRFVTDTCVAWQADGLADDARVVASELVENAVRHGKSRALVRLELRRGVLTIAVRDDHPAPPEHRSVGLAPTGGRGVFMIDALARTWGFTPTWGGGKVVWAVLAAPHP